MEAQEHTCKLTEGRREGQRGTRKRRRRNEREGGRE